MKVGFVEDTLLILYRNNFMNKNLFLSIAAVATVVVATSCSSKLGILSADNFKVTPTPLELQGNKVPATITGTFPEKYMAKKAVVTVTPELRGANGTVVKGQPVTFQGEKVNGNDQTISYLVGGHYTMRDAFDYNDDLHASDLYLTFDAKIGSKSVNVPAIKVGEGVVATSGLYKKAVAQGTGVVAADTFQQVRKARQEASINFLINQAQLRKSELKNNSVQEFVSLLNRINEDAASYNLKDVEVLAYASPEGKQDFNDKLAGKRQRESEKYVDEVLKNANLSTDVTGNYTAEDWDGFQKLVQVSNIQDKELILRVLNMYQDPQEREQQIRNMSQAFRELATDILPQLRRARMIINYETVGRSDEQILAQYKQDPSKLSVDELLYCATLVQGTDNKENIYKKCAELYPSDYRAFNNIASCEFAKGNNSVARDFVKKALNINPSCGEAQANLALAALQEGNIQQAEALMAKAGNCDGINKVKGAINFAKGNYAQAAADLKGINNNMTALAQIQAKDYAAARATFTQMKDQDAMSDYIHAILCAREGNKYATNSYLQDAIKKDPSLSKYANGDLEFAGMKE